MPSESEHKAAFDRHLKSYQDTVEGHPDWAAVMLFYCAVQQVERLFANDNIHSCEHSSREYQIKTRYHSLWPDYRTLKSESLKTRYLEGGAFLMSSTKVKKKLHDERLASIIRDINGRLASRGIVSQS